MSRVLAAALLALAAPALSSCGFTPLYATGGGGLQSELRGVTVGQVNGPADASYYAQAALREALPGGAATRYTIALDLRDQRQSIGVTRSAETTRYDYTLQGRYRLTDAQTGETRVQTIQTVVSYGTTDSQYASLVGREDAVRRAALELARRIETDVALYLKGRAPEPSEVTVSPVVDRGGRGELGEWDEDEITEGQLPDVPEGGADGPAGAGAEQTP